MCRRLLGLRAWSRYTPAPDQRSPSNAAHANHVPSASELGGTRCEVWVNRKTQTREMPSVHLSLEYGNVRGSNSAARNGARQTHRQLTSQANECPLNRDGSQLRLRGKNARRALHICFAPTGRSACTADNSSESCKSMSPALAHCCGVHVIVPLTITSRHG
jgi:hypothetical protein